MSIADNVGGISDVFFAIPNLRRFYSVFYGTRIRRECTRAIGVLFFEMDDRERTGAVLSAFSATTSETRTIVNDDVRYR